MIWPAIDGSFFNYFVFETTGDARMYDPVAMNEDI